MFKFSKEQQIFDIEGVKIGGQPGQFPTVMIGSIFYFGHKIVADFERGIFDKKKAEDLLRREEEMSMKTGNPRIIDVNGSSPESFIKFIDFVAEKTESPFLLDAANTETRIAGLRHVSEVGPIDRAIFNSINPLTKTEETAAIREAGLKSAIILLFNKRRPTIGGRMDLLRTGMESRGLLKISKDAGIDKLLIDTTVIGVPDPGPAAKAIHLIKKEYGLPSGCGPHNAVDMWHKNRKLDPKTRLTASIVACTTPIIMGADFILYGPIGKSAEVYMACALADAYVAYCMRQQFKMGASSREHPLYKIFK